jgi:epoxyqueuosine reductase
MELSADDWHGMTEVVFDRLFEGSAVKRTKYAGLQRNLKFLLNESSKSENHPLCSGEGEEG